MNDEQLRDLQEDFILAQQAFNGSIFNIYEKMIEHELDQKGYTIEILVKNSDWYSDLYALSKSIISTLPYQDAIQKLLMYAKETASSTIHAHEWQEDKA